MKSILISNLVSGMKLQGFYLCTQKKMRRKKDGSIYLDLLLQDKSGIIRARLWDNVESLSKKFDIGNPVAIKGTTYKYGENTFIKIKNIITILIIIRDQTAKMPLALLNKRQPR